MRYVFEVMGKVATKGRPRFRAIGNYVQTYTPDKTVEYENLVRLSFVNAGIGKLEGNICAHITALFPIPKSVSKKKRLAMEGKPYPHKGDCDNIAKIILDSLNGIAYDDDCQVVVLTVEKYYTSEEPKAIITLRTEDNDDVDN